jgi:hypothetical protein
MSQQLLISYGPRENIDPNIDIDVPMLLVGLGGNTTSTLTAHGGAEGGEVIETTLELLNTPSPVSINLIEDNGLFGQWSSIGFLRVAGETIETECIDGASNGTTGNSANITNGGNGGQGGTNNAVAGGAGVATSFFSELSGTVNLYGLPLTLGLFSGGGGGANSAAASGASSADLAGQNGQGTSTQAGATRRGTYGTGRGGNSLGAGTNAYNFIQTIGATRGPALISLKVPSGAYSTAGFIRKVGNDADYLCKVGNRPSASVRHSCGNSAYISKAGTIGNLILDNESLCNAFNSLSSTAVLPAFSETNVFAVLVMSVRSTSDLNLTASGWTKYLDLYANSTADNNIGVFYKAYPSGNGSPENVTLSHAGHWSFALFTNASSIVDHISISEGLVPDNQSSSPFSEEQILGLPSGENTIYHTIVGACGHDVFVSFTSNTDLRSCYETYGYSNSVSNILSCRSVRTREDLLNANDIANISGGESSTTGTGVNKVVLAIR